MSNFQKTLIASTIFVALSTASFAETPASAVWDSATVPQGNWQYQFSGSDVSGLANNYWSALTVDAGASGKMENLDMNIQAIGPKDGTQQDKQVIGIEINGGAPEFSGDKLNVTINTDFIGGGNNQATAIEFFSSGTTTISAKDVELNVTSSNANGKSVYGIGLGSGGTMNVTSKTLKINLTTSTARDESSGYSQAIGLDVYQNGLLQISEDTAVTINVKSIGETLTTNNKNGATSAYGILYEGGRGDIKGKLDITASANGGNAVGIGVTNYFYNTSMGENWGSVAANLADVTVNATSTQGKAAGIEAAYTAGQTNDVILKVHGTSDLTATTESGEAVGVDVSGKTSVELDGNLTSTAIATDETGKAFSVKTSEGTLAINGKQNQLNGDVDVSDAGTLTLGANSKTTVDGNITTVEGTTLKLDEAELNLAAGNTANVQGTLSSNNGTIVLNEVAKDGAKLLTLKELSGKVAVAASGELNDRYGSAAEALAAMQQSIDVKTDGGDASGYTFEGRSSGVSDSWTANSDGEITAVTQNESLDALQNFSAMTLVAWRGENNHLTQRLGDIRDNAGNIGAWARVYGYDSEYSDVVNVNYKSNAIQAGADFRFAGNYVAGAAFSYTDGEGNFTNGSADAESYSLAAYVSGFFDCGGYFDVIGRVGRMSTDISAANQTNVMKADYDNTTLGLSAEIGWRYNVNPMFYVEPQAELSYGLVLGDDFTASNGVKVEQDDYQSLVGRLGARIGANFADNKGSVYMTASVNHDFLGDADFTAKSGAIAKNVAVDAGGTWVSYGIGAQFNTSANLNFYGSLEKSSGSEYSEDYRYNVGLRYVW